MPFMLTNSIFETTAKENYIITNFVKCRLGVTSGVDARLAGPRKQCVHIVRGDVLHNSFHHFINVAQKMASRFSDL